MVIKIIPYIDVYQDQIISLVSGVLDEFCLPVKINEQPDMLQISQFYQNGQGNFWLALHDNKVIGTVALVSIGNGQGTLRKMFVDKDYRGNEKKVAQSLLGILLVWCNQQKIEEIYLGTRAIFLAAQQFYKKNGFQEISKGNLPDTFPLNPVDSKFYLRCL